MHEFSKWFRAKYGDVPLSGIKIAKIISEKEVIDMACELYHKETGKDVCIILNLFTYKMNDNTYACAVDTRIRHFEEWLGDEFTHYVRSQGE